MNDTAVTHKDTKKLFRKLGTCSRTFFFILNRDFGNSLKFEEAASATLAGGILQQGHQCGMLFGSTMAVGAESFRRCGDREQAISMAITSTQYLSDSLSKRENSVDCQDITKTDFSSKLSMAKYVFTGKFLSCFTLADKWAPEAIQAAKDGLEMTKEAKETEASKLSIQQKAEKAL